MKIELWPLSKIKPYANNPRLNDTAVDVVATSISEFGFRQPIVVDADGVIICGHTRFKAAQKLGLEKVSVHVAKDLTPEQIKAYRVADNQTAQLAEWDMDLLPIELSELRDAGFDLELLGFSPDELSHILGNQPKDGLCDEDLVPEIPDTPITNPGDVWLLGDHRLLCGDSTRAEDVSLVMNGCQAVACITDPPYSVNYEESHKQRGGSKSVHQPYHEADTNPADLLGFMALIPSDLLVFSYSVNRHIFVLCEKLKAFKWDVRKELVWVKDTFSFWMGAAYQQRHEPIWICTRQGDSFSGNVKSNQSTVLEYKRPKAHDLHPTAKPVELWRLLVANHSNSSDILYEPFSGSGTTMIAAEQLGRKCYGIEISPAYCDTAVNRFQRFSGKPAVLERTGDSPIPMGTREEAMR